RTEQIVSVVSPRHPIERSSVDVTDRRERLDARITLDIGHKAVHAVIGSPEIRQPRFADGNARGEVDTNVATGVEYCSECERVGSDLDGCDGAHPNAPAGTRGATHATQSPTPGKDPRPPPSRFGSLGRRPRNDPSTGNPTHRPDGTSNIIS